MKSDYENLSSIQYFYTYTSIVGMCGKNYMERDVICILLSYASMENGNKKKFDETGIIECKLYIKEIARSLSTSKETLSRTLNKLENRNWITHKIKRISDYKCDKTKFYINLRQIVEDSEKTELPFGRIYLDKVVYNFSKVKDRSIKDFIENNSICSEDSIYTGAIPKYQFDSVDRIILDSYKPENQPKKKLIEYCYLYNDPSYFTYNKELSDTLKDEQEFLPFYQLYNVNIDPICDQLDINDVENTLDSSDIPF